MRVFAYGTLEFPYRRRMLTRWLFRAVLHVLHVLPNSFVHLGNHTVTTNSLVEILLAFTCVLLAILAARLLLVRLLGKGSRFCWLALLVVYISAYQFVLAPENRVQVPYDLVSVVLFGLATYAAFTGNRWLFYPVFVLATFNRESTLFLPFVFLVFDLRADLPLLGALKSTSLLRYAELALQLALWTVVLHICERMSGGPAPLPMEFRHNLHLLVNPLHWPGYLSLFGFLWLPYIVFFGRIGDVRLQRIALLAPFWAAAMFLHADLLEIRVNSEWTVYIAVCIAMIVANSMALRDDRSPSIA